MKTSSASMRRLGKKGGGKIVSDDRIKKTRHFSYHISSYYTLKAENSLQANHRRIWFTLSFGHHMAEDDNAECLSQVLGDTHASSLCMKRQIVHDFAEVDVQRQKRVKV